MIRRELEVVSSNMDLELPDELIGHRVRISIEGEGISASDYISVDMLREELKPCMVSGHAVWTRDELYDRQYGFC